MDKRYIPPLSLCCLVGILWFAQVSGLLPPTADLTAYLVGILKGAGSWVVLLIACIENIVGVNSYFPGAVPLLMLASTAKDIVEITNLVVLIFCGQIIGLLISFGLGASIASKNMPKKNLDKKSVFALPLFAHPQSAAATAFLWGSTYRWNSVFILILMCALWSAFWGCFIYLGGSFVIQEIGWDYVTIAVCSGWILWLLAGDLRTKWGQK